MLMHSYLLIVLLNRCIQWGSVSVHTYPIDIRGNYNLVLLFKIL